MGLASLFKPGAKYFDKSIEPKCDYCQFGKRAKDGNKVLCEKKGLVDCNSSCGKFVYSPLKRIPVKQLNFVGSLADDDMYRETASDIAEKEGTAEKESEKNAPKPAEVKEDKTAESPAEASEPTETAQEKPAEESGENKADVFE
ncbi:MAG: hypothetical protein PUB66_03450 [Oscillospiraceae bacterium]|nr:hypothetical protein [Oscillospiraceae bacterium]